jgi:protein-S-isoprenylcysteine O-methyltransferase Ste14
MPEERRGPLGLRDEWINLLHSVATGSRKIRIILTPLGALGFFALITLFVLVFSWIDDLLNLPKLLPQPYNVVLSIPFLAAGLFLVLWCLVHFRMAKGTPVPFNPPQRLVTSGPYQYTRNPMLTGVFSVLFAIGLLLNSIMASLVFTPLFIALNVIELKCIEEPELERRLGQPYTEYRQKVPMFFPWPRGKNKE